MDIGSDGYAILPGVFSASESAELADELDRILNDQPGSETIRGDDVVYAARNVLELWPKAATIWRRPALIETILALLGSRAGLVRVLYFDKPPGQTWALPWHKDLTIAVREARRGGTLLTKPTNKAGVPHVEASLDVLEKMVTARIHLDAADADNGALQVVAGSHRSGKTLSLDGPVRRIFSNAGDVLLMRPLISHCSGRSQEGTRKHRRVLHLEFAASPELPESFAWHTFLPVSQPGNDPREPLQARTRNAAVGEQHVSADRPPTQ